MVGQKEGREGMYVKLVSITLSMRNCVAMATDPPVLSLCLSLLYSSTMYSALSLLI